MVTRGFHHGFDPHLSRFNHSALRRANAREIFTGPRALPSAPTSRAGGFAVGPGFREKNRYQIIIDYHQNIID